MLIANCYSKASLVESSSSDEWGGIAGYELKPNIVNCYFVSNNRLTDTDIGNADEATLSGYLSKGGVGSISDNNIVGTSWSDSDATGILDGDLTTDMLSAVGYTDESDLSLKWDETSTPWTIDY